MKRGELLRYYNDELRFIRQLAQGFAKKHPDVAGQLMLDPQKASADPHVERLIESFAMLSARVHQRLDDDFSEISDALLAILYPHYLAPVPSMTIVEVICDPDTANIDGGFKVARKSLMYTQPVRGLRCSFRTAYSLALFPLKVASVDLVNPSGLSGTISPGTQSALRIRLETEAGAQVDELGIDSLRFFLDAPAGDVHRIHELFLKSPLGLMVRENEKGPAELFDATHVRPVGFGRDEGILEYPPESFVGYRVVQEYFAFPEKFLFVELGGIESATRRIKGGELELLVLLPESIAQIDVRVAPENLKLGCTPAVNLFPHTADPIRLTHAAVEYPVIPDARSPGAYEVHSVREVSTLEAGTAESRVFAPFYGVRHGAGGAGQGAFWRSTRRPSMRSDDDGTEVFLSLVDSEFDLLDPPTDVLHVETLCTNRQLPAKLPFGDPNGDFQLEGRPGIQKIVALRKPSDPLPAPIGSAARWRLISHLSLNYLSLSNEGDLRGVVAGAGERRGALSALHEILRLYDFQQSGDTNQRIVGLVGLSTRPIVRRAGKGSAAGFARGLEAELTFDPAQYASGGLFLFASVLEHFLGLYTSVNSFVQTVAKIKQQTGELKRWPPRAGEIQLV